MKRKHIILVALTLIAVSLYKLLFLIAMISGFIFAADLFFQAMAPFAAVVGIQIPDIPDVSQLGMLIVIFAFGMFLLGYGVAKRR